MTPPSFLSIPITLREQIYDELLTARAVTSLVSPICAILLLNRQVYHEVNDYLASKLLILIQTNDPLFIRSVLGDAARCSFPIISQLKLRPDIAHKDVSKAPIAMKVQFHMYRTHERGLASYPVFLIPASSLRILLDDILASPRWMDWTMQASISFQISNTFTYTQLRAEELLIGPWLEWIRPVKFLGVETDASISRALTHRLKGRLVGQHIAEELVRKFESLRHAALEKAHGEEWDLASERYSMASRYATLLWECHLACLRDASEKTLETDLILLLWAMVTEDGANHIQCFINAASDGRPNANLPTGCAVNNANLMQARQIGEEIIRIQSNRPSFGSEEMFNDETAQVIVRKGKAVVCYRLHVVCRALGDLDAAVGYLRDAYMYEPENTEKFERKAKELIAEGARDTGDAREGVVSWETDIVLMSG
ncbi:hypothetical protein BKA66DRAFT_472460 [Pyrenochaeta sp. MPI-SDFR-AT-0127]|nr:hypothetical protein BKA66DRAFT_472460 [Pyrenochaeta sp. MPI-SDFR-AT-0127]